MRFPTRLLAMCLAGSLASPSLGTIGNGHEARGIVRFSLAVCPVPHAASNFGSQALAECPAPA